MKKILDKKNSRGITLVALVITVIVLLILTGVTIKQLVDNGIVDRTQKANKANYEAEAIEEIRLIVNHVQIEKEGEATLNDIVQQLKKEKNTYIVTKASQVALLDISGMSSVADNIDTIYVTNIKYGVETKINKDLEISVNGRNNNSGIGTIDVINVSVEQYKYGNISMGITVNINNLPNEEYIDYNNSRFIINTSNSELGVDSSLYTDGSLNEGTVNNLKWSINKAKSAGTYYAHILLVENNGSKTEIISPASADVVGVKNFEYTGDSQSVELLPGKYKIECWGAQGGGYIEKNTVKEYIGGKGAYTTGKIVLENTENLYVYVGGTTSTTTGGYNGGGTGAYFGGGGSTDIRLTGGIWNNSESLASRIMVAAGGSGGHTLKGAAGGIINGILADNTPNPTLVTVATQTIAGAGGYFGYAGSSTKYTGAGGGYYSGGTGAEIITDEDENIEIGTEGETVYLDGTYKIRYGKNGYWAEEKIFTGSVTLSNSIFGDPINGTVKAGYKTAGYHYISSSGSSYISGHVGCIGINAKNNLNPKVATYSEVSNSYHYSGYYFTDTNILSGNSEMPSTSGSSETGHSGNGYVKITCIE